MTEEKINVIEEKQECNCPICKFLKSDCTKKFFAVVLASFIGCSLANIAFAPKKPKFPPRHQVPYVKIIEKQLPPPMPWQMKPQDYPGFYKNCPCREVHVYKSERLQRPDFIKDNCPRKFDKKYNGKYNGRDFKGPKHPTKQFPTSDNNK